MYQEAMWMVLVLAMVGLGSSAQAMDLTAITVFGCDEQGVVNHAFRVNTGPIDAAWDLFLYRGPVFDPAGDDPDEIEWLHRREDHTIRIPLTPGTHEFTFHTDYSQPMPYIGMNLFFNGVHDRPAISVMAPMDAAGPPYPDFVPNRAHQTMGWPITDIPAAGEMSYDGSETGLWQFVDPQKQLLVTLRHFRCSVPAVDGDLDLVGPHAIGPNGRPDFIGRFVLQVEEFVSRPADLFLWLQTRAEITV